MGDRRGHAKCVSVCVLQRRVLCERTSGPSCPQTPAEGLSSDHAGLVTNQLSLCQGVKMGDRRGHARCGGRTSLGAARQGLAPAP
jgi:hypothetical protein